MEKDVAVAQPTRVADMREIIENIRVLSVDLKEKTLELGVLPPRSPEKEVVTPAEEENVSGELLSSLRNIRGILREALDILSIFV